MNALLSLTTRNHRPWLAKKTQTLSMKHTADLRRVNTRIKGTGYRGHQALSQFTHGDHRTQKHSLGSDHQALNQSIHANHLTLTESLGLGLQARNQSIHADRLALNQSIHERSVLVRLASRFCCPMARYLPKLENM